VSDPRIVLSFWECGHVEIDDGSTHECDGRDVCSSAVRAGLLADDVLAVLLKLYRPNTGRGNFQPDVANRGANRILVKIAAALAIASEQEIAEHFKRLDTEALERSEAAIARAEAADRERGR
jgi:hypothetical protein